MSPEELPHLKDGGGGFTKKIRRVAGEVEGRPSEFCLGSRG